MIKKLTLLGLLIVSCSSFADAYSDYQQRQYQQDMLRQQKEQTRIMQEQLQQQQEAQAQQRMFNDNRQRKVFFGNGL